MFSRFMFPWKVVRLLEKCLRNGWIISYKEVENYRLYSAKSCYGRFEFFGETFKELAENLMKNNVVK